MAADVLKHKVFKATFNLSLLLTLFVFLLTSCASHYFKPLPAPSEFFRIKDLGDLPYRELWQGFVFNGEKVGFVHLKIVPMSEVHQYQILSEAYMRIRFLGIDKQITIKSDDAVMPDLTLVSFHYEQKMDEKPLIIDGKTTGNKLMIIQKSGGEKKTAEIDIPGVLYPLIIINLYPVLQGMGTGSAYQ